MRPQNDVYIFQFGGGLELCLAELSLPKLTWRRDWTDCCCVINTNNGLSGITTTESVSTFI